MTLEEFQALPESMEHIELIDGELIVSPAPKNKHQSAVFNAAVELRQQVTQGTVVISPMDVYLDDGNVLQPDVFWVSGDDSLCQLGPDDYWHGAPDLVVEVLSPSTALRDHSAKFDLYQKHGTREYWLIDTSAQIVHVYRRDQDMLVRAGTFGREQTFTLSVLPNILIHVSAFFS